MLNWFTEQEFSKKWEEKHKLNKEFITPALHLNFNYKDINNFANTEVFIDGIGTGHYWMGEIDGLLFSIEAVEDDFESITICLPKTQVLTNGWEYIKTFEQFFGNCISGVRGIYGEGDRQYSLFYKEDGITNCLYTGCSEHEAECLMKYLRENGSPLFMCVALTDHHFENWSGESQTSWGCRYNLRSATERFVRSKNEQKPSEKWKAVSEARTNEMNWALWRQDDNGNKFHIQDFEYEVDANFKVMEFEAKGHKQTYWREKIES